MIVDEGGGASRTTDPAAGSSAATDVSLREHFGASLAALDRHLTSELDAIRREVAAEIARIETLMRALITAEHDLRLARRQDDLRAIDKAEESMTKRLDAMNEIREQLNAQASSFMTLATFAAESDKIDAQLDRNRDDIENIRRLSLSRDTFESTVAEWTRWRGLVDNYMAGTSGAQIGSRATVGTLIAVATVFAAIIGGVVVVVNIFVN